MLHDLLIATAIVLMLLVLILGIATFFVFLCERSEEWERTKEYQRLREEVLTNARA